MKKKIIAVSIITAMFVCNSMTVWAADTWSGTDTYTKGTSEDDTNADRTNAQDSTIDKNSGEKDVTATFGISSAGTVRSVDISWGSLVYEPTGTLTGTWSEQDGYYKVTGHTGWEPEDADNNSDKIKITNRSNINITATFNPKIDSNFKANYFINSATPSFSLTDTSKLVKSSNNLLESESNEYTNTVTVSGIIDKAPNAQTADTKITLGTVTVTISE